MADKRAENLIYDKITFVEILKKLIQTNKFGEKVSIEPQRMGMPGTPEEGIFFGPPKRDTKYPITHVKLIRERSGKFFLELISEKAGSKPVTYRAVDFEELFGAQIERQMTARYAVPERTPEEVNRLTARQWPFYPPVPVDPRRRALINVPQPTPPIPEPETTVAEDVGILRRTRRRYRAPVVEPFAARREVVQEERNVAQAQERPAAPVIVDPLAGRRREERREPERETRREERPRVQERPPEIPKHTLIIDSHPLKHAKIKIYRLVSQKRRPVVVNDDFIAQIMRTGLIDQIVRNTLPEEIRLTRGREYEELSREYLDNIVTAIGDFNRVRFENVQSAESWFTRRLRAFIPISIDPGHLVELVIEASNLRHVGESRQDVIEQYNRIVRNNAESYRRATEENLQRIRNGQEPIEIEWPFEFSRLYRSHGFNLIPLDSNFFTQLTLDLEEGDYIIELPVKLEDRQFNRWEVHRPSIATGPITFSRYAPYTTGSYTTGRFASTEPYQPGYEEDGNSVRLLLKLNERIYVTGFYGGEKAVHGSAAEHVNVRSGAFSSYNTGSSGRRDTATSVLGNKFLGGRLSKKENLSKFGGRDGDDTVKGRPRLRAAINKGKRLLNGYAKAEYTRMIRPLNQLYGRDGQRREALENARRNAERARNSSRAILRGMGQRQRLRNMMDVANESEHAANNPAVDPAEEVVLRENIQVMRDFDNMRDRYTEQLEHDFNAVADGLKKYLQEKAGTISVRIARNFRMPVNSEEQTTLKSELENHAQEIAEEFIARGRTPFFTFIRGMRALSGAALTTGDVYYNILNNLWTLITGPWTTGSIFALIQFYFMLTWIGYDALLLFIFPIAGGIFTLLVNFEASKQPMDWFTHLLSGIMISQATIIFMFALGTTPQFFADTLNGPFWFYIVGAFLFGFIGVFQFYQTGGHKTILMGSIFIMLFGYIALGPYSVYWTAVKDQVKEPLAIAARSIEKAFSDVYLLATNPTEFYARQQLVNVRPEKPISFAKALEITTIEALPPTVPSGEQFAVVAVLKNDGDLKASEVEVTASCNKFCTPAFIKTPTEVPRSEYEPKEADRVLFSGLTATGLGGDRSAELQRGIVTINATYKYQAKSSLLVTIMSDEEINRRQFEGEDIFKSVVAVSKVSPAQLSLNVGPQPLKANNQNSLLLVSVSNTRDDGTVILKRGQNIDLSIPEELGVIITDKCTGQVKCYQNVPEGFIGPLEVDASNVRCEIQPTDPNQKELKVVQYEFQSIFAFLCPIKTASTEISETELITAVMDGYTYEVSKKKDVIITTPLGIIANPYEATCNRCGGGVFNLCGKNECHSLSTGSNQCWYYDPNNLVPGSTLGSACHSCGGVYNSCSAFEEPEACNTESGRCGLNCVWNSPDPLRKELGKCEPSTGPKPGEGPIIGPIGTITCSEMPASWVNGFNIYSSAIIAAANRYEFPGVANPAALIAAVINTESAWDPNARGSSGEVGLMQIIPRYHRECDETAITNDPVANIDCGAKIISNNLKDCGSIEGALRKYNSGECNGRTAVPDYVSKIMADYQKWIPCIQNAVITTPTETTPEISVPFGSSNFCQQKIEEGWGQCSIGEGECIEGQCGTAVQFVNFGSKTIQTTLECRDPGISKMLCCSKEKDEYTIGSANSDCINFYNSRSTT